MTKRDWQLSKNEVPKLFQYIQRTLEHEHARRKLRVNENNA